MSVSSIQLKTPASDQAPLLQSEKMVIPPELVTHILKQIPLIEIPHLAKLSQTWCFFVKSSKTKSALIVNQFPFRKGRIRMKHPATYVGKEHFTPGQISNRKLQMKDLTESQIDIFYRTLITKRLDQISETKNFIQRIQNLDFGIYVVGLPFKITPFNFRFGCDKNNARCVLIDGIENRERWPNRIISNTYIPASDEECLYVPQHAAPKVMDYREPPAPLTELVKMHKITLENGTFFEFEPIFVKGSPGPVATQVLFNGKLIKTIKSKIYGLPIYEENRIVLLGRTKEKNELRLKIWDFNLRPLTIAKKLKVKIIYGY